MKPALAFTVGLWTGALAVAAISLFYAHQWGEHSTANATAPVAQDAESRVQIFQQQAARSVAEAERLRQTVAELEGQLAAQAAILPPGGARMSRRVPFRTSGPPDAADWILQSVSNPEPATVMPRLERAAGLNDLSALDALALLADRDNAEALSRVWSGAALDRAAKNRATMLLGATVEVNPHGEELLQSLTATGSPSEELVQAALAGLETPNFATRLLADPAVPPPPHFKPDYGMRLRIADGLRSAVTDQVLNVMIDRVRGVLAQRAGEAATAAGP